MSFAPPPAPTSDHTDSRVYGEEDSVDFRELFGRLGRGASQIVGVALLGLLIGAVGTIILSRVDAVATSTRIVFSFPGFERGEYPDKSKFQADDLTSPVVVAEALRRVGLDQSSEVQAKIRGALNVEGIVPPNVVKERDRLRAAGQPVPKYVPDEYELSLILPRDAALSAQQRGHLLNEIVGVYRENFGRTYAEAPLAFGTAFETLRTADFPEYELIFNSEMESIRSYLMNMEEDAKSFRSQTTNFTFKDLEEQTELFAQIRLNEVLGLIHENGLSRNRGIAKMKMNNYLRLLDEREQHALQDQKVVLGLLDQAQAQSRNVVLGIKSQVAQPKGEAPVLDQGLIDSLLQNDANNFLMRKALDAGLAVTAIQAEKARLLDLRDNMISFMSAQKDQSAIIAQVDRSVTELKTNYDRLIDNIRKTHADYAAQQYGDAVRLSDSIRTPGVLKPMAVAGMIGGFLGLCLGAGMSLLGIYVGKRSPAATASAT